MRTTRKLLAQDDIAHTVDVALSMLISNMCMVLNMRYGSGIRHKRAVSP